MTRLEFRGGWYCDATPSGSWAVLFPDSHIQTSRGRVPLPPGGNVLFLVCAEINGAFYLAGQGHQDGQCWLWNGTWQAMCPTYGTSPCAFGPQGLYVSIPGAQGNIQLFDPLTRAKGFPLTQPLGSRGIAAVDTAGVHGQDGWYGQHGLAEYVDVGLSIGQGANGGCVVAGAGELEPGDVQFVRVHRSGDALAVAMWKPTEKMAVIHFLTVAEVNTPPVVVPPVVVPQPKPEPKPMSTPNRLEVAQRIAAQHHDLIPLNTTVACGTLTEYIALALHAEDPGWGLLSKSAGENNYRGHGVDAVIYQPTQQVIDLMSGAGDRDPDSTVPLNQRFDIRVKWDEVGKRDGNHWMAPIQPVGVGTPPPVTLPPVQPPSPDPALLARIAMLEEENRRLEADNRTLSQHPDYAARTAMIAAVEAAYQAAQPVKKDSRGRVLPKVPMNSDLASHLTWRFAIEGFSEAALIEDARERGAFV